MLKAVKAGNTLVTKFTIMILFILVVGQGLLYTWLLLYQKSYLESRLRSEVLISALGIADAFSTGEGDERGFEQLLDMHVKRGLALSIQVTDGTGTKLAEKTEPRQLKLSRTDKTGFGPLAIFFIPSLNTMRVPLKADAGHAGSVEVIYSGRPVNEVMKRFLVIPPIMQFITFVFVTYAIIAFFRKKVTLPVESINKVLKSITARDLTVQAPDLGESEIGSISKGLQFLIENLSMSIVRFNSLSSHAASTMERMTLTLAQVSETARKQAHEIDGVISAIRSANAAQKGTTENTDKLAEASSENVSSLLEMKAAAEEIAASTERLFASTTDSYAMIAEMSQTSKVIADNAGEVSRAVEETSSSVEEISASLNAVRENTRTSSGLSAKVRVLLTDRGTLTIADAVEAMEKIEEQVIRTEKIITQLAERSKDIEKILSVITDVSAKTNVLGLNAAILAAAAGEHGKGFSIVADEIRGLSDRTSSSAQEIAAILGRIKTEIHEAVEAIGAGVRKVDEGMNSILKSGEAIGESLEAAQKSAHMAAVVEKAAGEQAEGLRQIRLSMENVRNMIGQVAKATEEEKKGSAYMLETISDVKAVAELVKKGTGDHVRGTTLISKNLALTSNMVSQMRQSGLSQLKVNEDIVHAVEEIKYAGNYAMKEMEDVAVSFSKLKEEIDVLKQEMKKFKTKNISPASQVSI